MNMNIGDIPVFKFTEASPEMLRAHPENDLFIAYDGNGNPRMCIWGDGAFWYSKCGETEDAEIVLNVEYWFRVPKAEEIVDGEEK